jgi:hypothetical protein
MIAETPSSLCTRGATSTRRKQMAAARGAARVCARAWVVGVAFFDYLHGQTGVARNGIELHPVLGFACLSKVAAPPPRRLRGASARPPTRRSVSRRRPRPKTQQRRALRAVA